MFNIDQAVAESTCLKRVTVCLIADEHGNVLSCESNRCDPPGGVCQRLNVVSKKEGYPEESTCNWEHAEARAVGALPPDARPYLANIYGHEFPCPACEKLLKEAGVEHITVVGNVWGTGLRRKEQDEDITTGTCSDRLNSGHRNTEKEAGDKVLLGG